MTKPRPSWIFGLDRAATIYVLIGVAAVALGMTSAKWEPTTFLFVGVTTTAAMLASIILRKPSRIWPFLCLLVAFLLFLVAGAIRGQVQTLGNLTATRSLVPDYVALPGYLLLAIGLLGFARSRARGAAQWSVILDASIAALALASLAWAFVVEPVLNQHQVPYMVKLVLTAYPPMSIFLVVVTLRIVFNADTKRFPAFWLCVGAMVFMFVGDGLYMFADINLLQLPAQLMDLPYAIAFLGAGTMAVHPTMRELTETRPEERVTASVGRTALVAAALLVAALLTLQYRVFTASDRIIMLGLFLSLNCAVVLRIAQAMHIAIQSEARLAFQAKHDALTGLPNRRMLEEVLSERLQRCAVDDSHVALLFLDLDRFKLINDMLGHHRGDDLLMDVAQRLQSNVRETDLVTRIGGDEFMVILDDVVTTSEAMYLADRLRACLADPFVLDGVNFFITVSVGLAFASGDDPHATVEALVRDADTAMYQAKQDGRDNVSIFDESMREQVSERVELERDLRSAVALDQLRLVYQPIIELSHGRIVGVEALIRWAHPKRGLLSPGQFIGVAEDIGIIEEIGDWVMEEAMSQIARWRRQSPIFEEMHVSVNLSSAQLRDDRVVHRVAELLMTHGLPGSALCLELTESLAMQDPMASAEILGRLQRLGVRVALDDFGAEYSSLAYLRRLPVSILKIDKSFVDSLLHEDCADASLIAAVVAMAKSLKITTVAEGVENSIQAARLLDLGVDSVQGFLYSCPVMPDKLVEVAESFGARRLRLVGALTS